MSAALKLHLWRARQKIWILDKILGNWAQNPDLGKIYVFLFIHTKAVSPPDPTNLLLGLVSCHQWCWKVPRMVRFSCVSYRMCEPLPIRAWDIFTHPATARKCTRTSRCTVCHSTRRCACQGARSARRRLRCSARCETSPSWGTQRPIRPTPNARPPTEDMSSLNMGRVSNADVSLPRRTSFSLCNRQQRLFLVIMRSNGVQKK